MRHFCNYRRLVDSARSGIEIEKSEIKNSLYVLRDFRSDFYLPTRKYTHFKIGYDSKSEFRRIADLPVANDGSLTNLDYYV